MSKQITTSLFIVFIINAVLFANSTNDSFKTFYIIGFDWHTGIVIEVSDIPDSLKINHPDFPRNKFLEIGWGDRAFYQNAGSDINYWLAVKAALFPTESALHINGFDQSVNEYYPARRIVELQVNEENFTNLCVFIYSAFARDSCGMEIGLGKGLYDNSQFFLGEDYYYFPKTCNVWTAQAIDAAGISIAPYNNQRAETLMEYLKEQKKK